MTEQHRLPQDAATAIERLASIGALVTSKEWDRAALVYALVGPAPDKPGPRPSSHRSMGTLTVTALVEKGIVGLLTDVTVTRYRDAWEHAIKAGKAQPVTFGDTYEVPDMPWPPTRTGTDGYSSTKGAERTIERIVEQHGASVLGQSLTPEVVEDVVKGMSPEAFKQVGEAVVERQMNDTLAGAGLSPLGQSHAPGDPTPRWRKVTFRIAGDLMDVKMQVAELREEGRIAEADMAVKELREAVLHAMTWLDLDAGVPNDLSGVQS